MSPVIPDFNQNGIPDYQEPAVWRFTGSFIARIVVTFAAKHTIAYKVARYWLDNVA